jgi:HlyD family secretion protein
LVSGSGRVEPASDELKISSQMAGRLIGVPVQEGQHLVQGQTIAVLDGGDLNARAAQAEANVQLRQAELDRLINGSTIYEKQSAADAVAEAKAVLDNAKAEMLQRKSLFESGDISSAEYQRSQREVALDQLKLDKATVTSASLDSPARADETARAQASLQAAREQVAEVRALLSQTVIRAPFSGTVLKKYHSAGEDVGVTEPIISFGDISRLIVRVDVDETDVAKVRVGQRAYFTAQAYGTKRFTGTVLRIGGQLGRKTIESDDPAEKLDTKVLETLVVLDDHPALPVGLRLDAFIEVGAGGR